MKKVLELYSNHYNEAFRLPDDIVSRNLQYPLLKDFMFVSVGHRDGEHNVTHYVRRDSKDEYILIYCTDGEGWVEYEDGEHRIQPGDLFFCLRGTVQCYGANKKKPWTIYWSCFRGKHVPYLLESIDIKPGGMILNIGNNTKIISLFSEMLSILKKGYAENHLFYVSQCLKLILNYLSVFKMYVEHKPFKEPIVNKAIGVMIEKVSGNITLEEISRVANLSADHFTKLFKQCTGYTPIDYYIRLKMQKACTMLNATDLSIKEIAGELGCDDVYYFSRIFKKKTGYSPKHYRSSVRN